MASTASSSSWEWSASLAEHVTSSTSRSRVESTTSIAVTTPPADAMAVATAPTTPWSGAVCSRMVIEYDEAVALTASPSGLGVRTASSGFLGPQVLEEVRGEPVPRRVDDLAHRGPDRPTRGSGQRQLDGDLELGDQRRTPAVRLRDGSQLVPTLHSGLLRGTRGRVVPELD